MDEQQHVLRGACNCGRYTYVVVIPENNISEAAVHFATDSIHRRATSSLLSSYLRVPLTWYRSSTTPFFPDESHRSISRTFTPVHDLNAQRKFCGYCGAQLSYWTESPEEEQDFMHVNVGSLNDRDLEILEDLGLLPDTDPIAEGIHETTPSAGSLPESALGPKSTAEKTDVMQLDHGEAPISRRSVRHGISGPLTWFEEMIDGSRLGHTRKARRGMGHSADGTTTISWEVSEYVDGTITPEAPPGGSAGAKRKLSDDEDPRADA